MYLTDLTDVQKSYIRGTILMENWRSKSPFPEESLWGKKCEGGYLIDNVPFFVYDISLDDVVSVKKKEGQLYFHQLLYKSTNSTIRIFSKDHALMEKVRQSLAEKGCYWEYSNIKSYSSVNIPIEVAEEIIAILESEEDISLCSLSMMGNKYLRMKQIQSVSEKG